MREVAAVPSSRLFPRSMSDFKPGDKVIGTGGIPPDEADAVCMALAVPVRGRERM